MPEHYKPYVHWFFSACHFPAPVNSADELKFWNIDEFEKWMEQEGIVYQELADNEQNKKQKTHKYLL